MKRKSVFLIGSEDGSREIHLDASNADIILSYLYRDERHRKKFLFIAEIILRSMKNTEVYDRERINDKANNITAMKFFKGQENDRIYCKEYSGIGKKFIVIAIVLMNRKKSQKNNLVIRTLINQISTYEYEF